MKRRNSKQWTIGRAPWYDLEDPSKRAEKQPFLIGVTGGTASGKTTVCHQIVKKLNIPWVVVLSMDSFYRSLTQDELKNAHSYNFDHPSAFDWSTMRDSLRDIKANKCVRVPKYDFKTHQRLTETETVYGADIVLIEGILVLYEKEIREQLDMKIFVDTDADLRLARRLKRDIVERGRTVDGVLHQYISTVKPAFDDFIYPTKRYADIIIPWTDHNPVAVELLVQQIRSQLERRGVDFSKSFNSAPSVPLKPLNLNTSNSNAENSGVIIHAHTIIPNPSSSAKETVEKSAGESIPSDEKDTKEVFDASAYPNLKTITHTPNIRELHTIIRDGTTDVVTLRWAVRRLSFLLFSEGMDLIPCEMVKVETPTKLTFVGRKLPNLCGVSIVRSGEALEKTLKEMFIELPIGKIVIKQTQTRTEGPRLYYARLPSNIKSYKVVLMDAILATGNALIMAIHVLLDHGIAEEDIYFFCLIAAPQGLKNLFARFPRVKVITSSIEDKMDEKHFPVPGIGAFGDRYFATDETDETKERDDDKKVFTLR